MRSTLPTAARPGPVSYTHLDVYKRQIKDHQWPGLAAVGKVERIREIAGKTTSETAYYLLSACLLYTSRCV